MVSQEKSISILKSAIKSNKVAQAYIFHGPEGVGKLLTAINFAKTLNCMSEDVESRPCGTCNSCKKTSLYQHPDVKLYFPIPNYGKKDDSDKSSKSDSESGDDKNKSQREIDDYLSVIQAKIDTPWKDYQFDKVTAIRIEQIRALQRDILKSRVEGRKKIYILESFDTLTIQAYNAFLKTLEEPPVNTHFILICKHLMKLLPTILSRCTIIEFHSVPTEKIEHFLMDTYKTDKMKAKLYSNLCNGNVAKAICLFYDQNLDSMSLTLEFLRIVLNKDDIAFLDWIKKHFGENTKNKEIFADFIQYLIIWLNDIVLHSLHSDKMVFINQIDMIKKFTYTSEGIHAIILKLNEFAIKFQGNVNPRLLLNQIYFLLINA